jgi:hypothetical protein
MAVLTLLIMGAVWMIAGFCVLLLAALWLPWFDRRLPETAGGALLVILGWPAVVLWISAAEAIRRARSKRLHQT